MVASHNRVQPEIENTKRESWRRSSKIVSRGYKHERMVILGGLVLGILFLSVGGSIYETHHSINASRSAFTVLDKAIKFTSDYSLSSTDFQSVALVYGYSERASLWSMILEGVISDEINMFDDLKSGFEYQKRKAPELKKASSKFNELSRLFDAVIESNELLIDLAEDFQNTSTLITFDEYVYALHSTRIFNVGSQTYIDFQEKLLEFTDELRKISVVLQTETQRITLTVQLVLLIVLFGLGLSLHQHFKEAGIKLAAQDKLLRQQMHEARNKFCPAMYMMEQFLETAQSQNASVKDFTSIADDMHMALVALKEVEAQHQARLDMYKILRGKYVRNQETFDVLELMRERSAVERTVALARARATNSPIAEFVSAVEDVNNPQQNSCSALFIKTDLYILSHVIGNLLSNARKFCSSGEINLSFNGTSPHNEDLLVFSVRDSGSGLPEGMDEKSLFGVGVASGDTRGSGLGLPSCHLFCRAGGGYIKLLGSKQVDEHSSGYTEFQFALKGKVVRADMTRQSAESADETKSTGAANVSSQIDTARASDEAKTSPSESADTVCYSPQTPCSLPVPAPPTCPDNLQVVIIDDSALNRTCCIRAFKKIERALNATGFEYFQFETIESSMPFFRELRDTSKVIVLLDENLESRGGVLRGIQCTRWLLHELDFGGVIISTSGDPDAGNEHLQEGPNVLNWGKPLPKFEKMLSDVTQSLASAVSTAAH